MTDDGYTSRLRTLAERLDGEAWYADRHGLLGLAWQLREIAIEAREWATSLEQQAELEEAER
jgi:hypothetical protein